MNYKNILPFLALIFTLQFISAQQSKAYYFDLKEYNEALTLYNNKQYQASQILFNKVYKKTTDNETIANCDYYIANCAIRLNQRGADKLMEAFVKNHPTSTKRNSAFMDVADYYFENGKYTLALKWYTMAEPSSMSKKEEERFNFNLGYCLFASKKYEQSKKYFNRLITSNQFGSQAKYYIGFMAYEGDDFQEASTYFDQISDDDRLNKKLSYYQADMNFKLGEFEKAISLAEQQLAKGDRKEVSELSKIIGESHFNLGNYGEAINFLTARIFLMRRDNIPN
jgi:tetratricopeptide (TPR) repeat protein